MSIHIMNQVWRHSKAHSGYLLVLLAIADHADDEGVAYPSIKGIAFKARMTERNVQLALAHLKSIGELHIDYCEGPHGKNLFQIVTPEADFTPKDFHPNDNPEADCTSNGVEECTPKSTAPES